MRLASELSSPALDSRRYYKTSFEIISQNLLLTYNMVYLMKLLSLTRKAQIFIHTKTQKISLIGTPSKRMNSKWERISQENGSLEGSTAGGQSMRVSAGGLGQRSRQNLPDQHKENPLGERPPGEKRASITRRYYWDTGGKMKTKNAITNSRVKKKSYARSPWFKHKTRSKIKSNVMLSIW